MDVSAVPSNTNVNANAHDDKELVTVATQHTAPRISDDLRAFYAEHDVQVDHLLIPEEEADQSGANYYSSHSPFPVRFIRLNPRFNKKETLSRLQAELQQSVSDRDSEGNTERKAEPVPWLEEELGFYALPGDFRLAQSACYGEGRIYGMDISSGAAVAALLSKRHDKLLLEETMDSPQKVSDADAKKANSSDQGVRILDLCCAPGLKLCAMADYLHLPTNNCTLVGVDISEHRMATCKRILHKYHIQPETSGYAVPQQTAVGNTDKDDERAKNIRKNRVRIRAYCCDGTVLDQPKKNIQLPELVFDSFAASEEVIHSGKRKRMNKSARARERKRLNNLALLDFDSANGDLSLWKAKLFDYVLVDAECSTDGSLKHIQKQLAKQPAHEVAQKLTDRDQLTELVQLQKKLASSGFRLLKEGGVMVYSTCSLSKDQNEHVVAWLLETFPGEAFLIPVDFSPMIKQQDNNATEQRFITHGPLGVRFHPNIEAISISKSPKEDGSPNIKMTTAPFFGGGFFIAKIGKRRKDG